MTLTATQRSTWDDNGWVVCRGSLSRETLERLRRAVDDLRRWAADDGPGLHHFEQTDHGPALARSERFADDHAELSAFVRSGEIVDPVAELFGEPAVLFKEKVNYKAPGGGGFAPHQDATAYRFADHHISVMVPLDPATIDSGCLWFAPGHHEGRLPTDAGNRIAESVVERLDWRPVEVEPGDVVSFDSFAPHRSDTNTAGHGRTALYLTYNAASAGDLRERYYRDKQAELDAAGDTFHGERVRISVNDDFLGRPVDVRR